MMRLTRCFSLCLVLGTLFASAPLHADESQAEALFKQAESAFAEEDFARAAALFEEANQHAPHASVLFNAAVSWDYAGSFARAANAYRNALEAGSLSPAQSEESERRLAALSERLGYVQIAKPVGGLASVAHIEREPIPTRFYLEPGDYEVTLETPEGATSTTSINVEGGQTLKVALTASLPPPEAVPPPPPPKPPEPPPREVPVQRIAGWVGIGIGVVAAGVAAYLGSETLLASDHFKANRSDAGAREDAIRLQTGTNIAWGSAGLTGGLGVILLLTAPRVEF